MPERIAITFRDGGHDHGPADWGTLLDFCDVVFRQAPRDPALEHNPFPGLPPAAEWIDPSRARCHALSVDGSPMSAA